MRKLSNFLVAFLCVGLVVGCSSDKSEEIEPTPDSVEIVIGEGQDVNPRVGDAESVHSVAFRASHDWRIEISKEAQSWLTVDPMAGSAGEANISITIYKNETSERRVGYVYIHSGDVEEEIETITISQAPAGSVVISEKEFKFGVEGGEFCIEVTSNVNFEMEEPNVPWIHSKGSRTVSRFNFVVDVNEQPQERVAEFKFVVPSLGKTEIVTVMQEAAVVKSDFVDAQMYRDEGGNLQIRIFCLTKDANYGSILMDDNTKIKDAQSSLGSLEAVIQSSEPQAFTKSWIDQMNSLEGLPLSYDAAVAGMVQCWGGLLDIRNEEQRLLVYFDENGVFEFENAVLPEEEAPDTTPIEVELSAYLDEDNFSQYTSWCTTHNAQSAECFAIKRSEVDGLMKTYNVINEGELIQTLKGQGQGCPNDWMALLNDKGGIKLAIQDNSEPYLCAMIVYTQKAFKGNYAIAWSYAEKQEHENEKIEATISAFYDVETDLVHLTAQCTTHNAKSAEYNFWYYDNIIKPDLTLEEKLEEMEGLGYQLNSENLELLNSEVGIKAEDGDAPGWEKLILCVVSVYTGEGLQGNCYRAMQLIDKNCENGIIPSDKIEAQINTSLRDDGITQFEIWCPTHNAKSAELFVLFEDQVDSWMKENNFPDMETALASLKGSGQKLTEGQLLVVDSQWPIEMGSKYEKPVLAGLALYTEPNFEGLCAYAWSSAEKPASVANAKSYDSVYGLLAPKNMKVKEMSLNDIIDSSVGARYCNECYVTPTKIQGLRNFVKFN